MNKRFTIKLIAALAMITPATALFAQQSVKVASIVELSGGGRKRWHAVQQRFADGDQRNQR